MDTKFIQEIAPLLMVSNAAIISHNDLDGVASAQIMRTLNLFWPSAVYFDYTDDVISEIRKAVVAGADTIIVTDYSILGKKVSDFETLCQAYPNVNFVWIDHHASNEVDNLSLPNLHTYIHRDADQRCGADLAYAIVHELAGASMGLWKARAVSVVAGLAHGADFYDKSDETAILLAEICLFAGPEYVAAFISDMIQNTSSYVNLINSGRLHEAKMISGLRPQILQLKKEAYESALASHQVVELDFGDHLQTVVVAVCQGFGSYIGAKLGEIYPKYPLAIFDMSSGHRPFHTKISFRRSPTCTVDLSELAKYYGGGGHDYASGAVVSKDIVLNTLVAQAVAYLQNEHPLHSSVFQRDTVITPGR